MPPGPAPADPGRDENLPGAPPGPHLATPPGNPAEPDWEPVITRPDPMTEEEREAWLDDLAEPFDPEEYPDPEGPPPGEDELTSGEVAEIREVTEAEALAAANGARSGTTGALAAIAARAGRRGPGQPGSARGFPGESSSRAASFGTGLVLDVMPGCPDLAMLADAAAGPDDTYDGASDDELIGVLSAWDRVEAHACARKLAAVAELIRRRPEPGCPLEGPARMPAACEEFTAEELAYALAEHRGRAEDLLTIAGALESRLPGTKAALRDGIVRLDKAWIIACATALLDPEEARQAEAMVLGRAGRLTPGGLRAAIARAVMDVAPEKARKRREEAARDARVQQWAEDSGNAALMGRELPRPRSSPRTSASPPGPASSRQPGWTATWTCCAPAPTSICSSAWIPGPARTLPASQEAPDQESAARAVGLGQQARTIRPQDPRLARCRPHSPGGST